MKKAEATRLAILEKAYELIYLNGYRATSIDDILATTEVTKGAFYYHFKNKDDMGVALIKDVLKPKFLSQVARIFHLESDAAEAIYMMVAILLSDNRFMHPRRGCPVANLIQEMAPRNVVFADALSELADEWKDVIVSNMEDGKKAGSIRPDARSESAARFVISSYWGVRNFGRMDGGNQAYRSYLDELKKYLNTLR